VSVSLISNLSKHFFPPAMLSSLVTASMPSWLHQLTSPPMDAEQLRLSLHKGQLQLHNVKLNPHKVNELLGAESPVQLLRGELRELSLKVDWKHLRTQPLYLQVSGLHLTWSHAPLPHSNKDGSGLVLEGGFWNEQDLLGIAEDRKLELLEAKVPLAPSLLEKIQEKAAAGSGSAGFFSSPLKKLITFVLTSLHIRVTDVQVEFESQEPLSSNLVPKVAASSTAAAPSVSSSAQGVQSTPVKIGFELKQCAIMETVPKQEVPGEVRNSSHMRLLPIEMFQCGH
jgi:hypothetical protein